MGLANLLYFYRSRLRARLVPELWALAGIAVGVALLFAGEVTAQSLRNSVYQLSAGVVGHAQLQVVSRGPRGFPASVMAKVERIPGVQTAAPVLKTNANLVGPKGQSSVTVVAGDGRLARMGGKLLRDYHSGLLLRAAAMQLPSKVAQETGVRLGGSVTVQIRGRSVRAPVGAILDAHDIGALSQSPVAMMPLRYGQALASMRDRVSLVLIKTDPRQEHRVEQALRRAVGSDLDVKPATADNRTFTQLAMPTDRSTSLFAAISALVGFMFAFNAILLMSRERRAVVAELRMAGFGGLTIVEVLAFDALVLGAAASAVGLLLGDELSRHLFDPSPGFLAYAFPVGNARAVTWQAVAIALGSGVLAAVLGTLAPLLAISSDDPLDAVEDDRLDRRRTGRFLPLRWLAVGSACFLAVSTAILVAAPGLALLGIGTLVVSMLLSLPVVLAGALALADRWRQRVGSIVPLIAVGELRSTGSRSVALATIAAIAVLGSTAIEGAHGDLMRGLDAGAHGLTAHTGLWVTASGAANNLATTAFSPDVEATLRTVPHVTAVRAYRGGFLDLGDRRAWVFAPPRGARQPVPSSQVVDGDAVRANARVRAGGWATLSEALAEQLHVRVGQAFTLAAPRPQTFRVAAVTTNIGWSAGALILNADDYARAWGTDDVSAFELQFSGVSPQQAKRAVQRALGPAAPFEVHTDVEREQQLHHAARDGLARLTQISRLMLIAAALAMAAAMGGMIWQRRQRLAGLKLVGVGYRRLWSGLIFESALLLAIGCTIGGVYGLYGQQMLDRALKAVTGYPIDASIGLGVAAFSLGVVATVALAVAAIPGYFAARAPTTLVFQE